MSKKKSKSSHKKRKKSKSSKFEFKWSYAVYAIIIAIFIVNLAIDFARADREWYQFGSGTFCGDCCNDTCDDCECVEEVDDDADDTEDTNNTTTTNNSPTINACSESVSASSSTSGDTFTYSYAIVSCQNTSLYVYLRGRNADTVSLFDGSVSEYGTPAGSGRRSSNENFTEICVELGNDQDCG